jgi:3-phosphoshikimate 1-carboxyvinyltransferase
MIATIHPSKIAGTIQAPASKSSMQRACAAALLHNGTTILNNPGISNDDVAALQIIQQLGVAVINNNNQIIINPAPTQNNIYNIHCGESGLGIRMFTPIAATFSQFVNITGQGSLLTRPMDFFDAVLPQLHVQITSNAGKLPLTVKGPLQPKPITVDGSLSSQFLTGLLFAYGQTVTQPTKINVTNLKSTPYINLTLAVMQQFGFSVQHQNHQVFTVSPKASTSNTTITYQVEADWSSASFLLVAGAICGNLQITGLDVFSTQADKDMLQALMSAGVNISVEANCITINAALKNNGKAFHFNATHCPDLFPPLVALAAYCNGTTAIEGVSRLAHKESNRALTLQNEFAKLGVTIKLQDDLMLIEGTGQVNGGNVHSNHDHRIAMACAVAALGAQGPVQITEAEAINKSYPQFYTHLQNLGANIITQ